MEARFLGPCRQVGVKEPPLQRTLAEPGEKSPERRRVEVDLVSAQQLEIRAQVGGQEAERPPDVARPVALLCEAGSEQDRERTLFGPGQGNRQGAEDCARDRVGRTAAPQLNSLPGSLGEPGDLDAAERDPALAALEVTIPAPQPDSPAAGRDDLERSGLVAFVDGGCPDRRGGGTGRARDQEMAHSRRA